MRSTRSLTTRAVHQGEPRSGTGFAGVLPIYQSTIFDLDPKIDDYHQIKYPRLNNLPNHQLLADKLASLEGGAAAVVASSGMAAISTTLLTVLRSGDHLLAQSCLYGGTHQFLVGDLADLGIEHTFVDGNDPAAWKEALRPNTRAFYSETLTNPLVEMADHEEIVAFSRRHRLTTMIDNTFATPVNFRPIEHGYDFALHSATKYLNGHSDLAAGAIVAREPELLARVLHRLNHLGGNLDPHACYLLNRGLKTLTLRVERQNANALALATFLEEHPAVGKVNHPGLASHSQHARAKSMLAGFGGMLSFELRGGRSAALALIDALEIPIHSGSLGGVESLVTLPSLTSHRALSAAERERIGITDGLVRLSVGIEDIGDLRDDFEQALGAIGRA
jgi:cystathionine beta-lyase/cystathionine gamma-synthase